MQFTYSKGLIWCFPLCPVLLSCCQPLFPSLPLLVKAFGVDVVGWSGAEAAELCSHYDKLMY